MAAQGRGTGLLSKSEAVVIRKRLTMAAKCLRTTRAGLWTEEDHGQWCKVNRG